MVRLCPLAPSRSLRRASVQTFALTCMCASTNVCRERERERSSCKREGSQASDHCRVCPKRHAGMFGSKSRLRNLQYKNLKYYPSTLLQLDPSTLLPFYPCTLLPFYPFLPLGVVGHPGPGSSGPAGRRRPCWRGGSARRRAAGCPL